MNRPDYSKNVLIAYYMFTQESIGMPLPTGKIAEIVKTEIKDHPERIPRLAYIASLCEGERTPLALYTKAYAYVWAGAGYRNQAIEALTEYIKNDEIPNELPDGTINIGSKTVSQRSMHKGWNYMYLAEAYEGERKFENAYKAYCTALKMCPSLSPAAIKRSHVLMKIGKMDEAISELKGYYLRKEYDSQLESSILNHIKKLEEKKEKGYVNKPRKKSLT